ncbi:hypothetical protein OU421_05860 [Methanogenium organophilum]|uniref:Uncharacterized protein n=1 Tax=Methanogenium organophilum TaxID=2199 RepID=A0A9X9T983_METOG|nr:hypothetical protein [Methanogenium organophilum]WAI02395.1 hypothetical protein OU421_05860 [Methanogenium organophilum]
MMTEKTIIALPTPATNIITKCVRKPGEGRTYKGDGRHHSPREITSSVRWYPRP